MSDYQALLFPYAYNILGSVEEAKDAIQDVLVKYTQQGVTPENEKNYLIRGVVNQSINRKRDLKKFTQSEHWLPEPIATERADVAAELREMVSYSLLFLLERLNPKERAVFILKEAFMYTHKEIAEVLSISQVNSRKLLSRAEARLKEQQEPEKPARVTRQQLKSVEQFTDAIRDRDLPTLHTLLTDEIVFCADGGTKVKVVKKYCTGIEEVAPLLIYVYHKFQKNYTIKPSILNHQPALQYFYKDQLVVCQVFEFDLPTNRIKGISVMLDPEKLKNVK